MVDTVTATAAVANDNDDWEVAVDTGEFDKRLAQHEKARASNQELVTPTVLPTNTDDDNRNISSFDIMKSNKPIRILKRPTSQSQLSTNNDVVNPSTATATAISTTTATTATLPSNNNNNANNSNSSSSYNSSSSATVPVVSIIPRNPTKDSTNSSEAIATPVFSSTVPLSQPAKPAIKTYEQRELEYRLARLRIMGEEESSAKDDDDDVPAIDVTPSFTDDTIRATAASLTSRQPNKISGFTQPPLQCHSTPGSYASDLYTLNNISSNTGAIHFTPNNNNNNSTSSLGTGPFSSPNFPQPYRSAYTGPYSHLLPTPAGLPRYPLAATTTTTLYMTSTAPFISAPSSSSSSSPSPSYHYPPQQHPQMSTNNWYHYQHPPTPYGTQQYGHPQ